MRPALGESVVITAIMRPSAAVNLKVGETLVVGPAGYGMDFEIDGFIWLNNSTNTKYGWVKWTYPSEHAEATVDIPTNGQRIEIVEVTSTAGGLYPDDVITVGQASTRPDVNGFVWVSTAPEGVPYSDYHYGWIKWKPVSDTQPAPQQGDIRARCGRQRRELRRLNKQNRELRLERDNNQYALENALEALVGMSRSKRLAEMTVQ